MAFSFRFNESKNQTLIATRGISFEEIIYHLMAGDLIINKKHHGEKWSHQSVYIVRVENYVYLVPYVIDYKKKEIFLKTAYPSRKYAKLYLKKGGNNEK